MGNKHFRLTARVSSADPDAIKPVLEKLVARTSIKKVGDEFVVEAEVEGTDARDLNRSFLSALRRAEKRTRLRAEWTSDDGLTYRFFDYVPKKAKA